VFAFAVPAACAVAIRMWYGELLRIARAARFVSEIEDWVNRSSSTTLGWERWMSECRALPGQDIDYANWRAVMQGFGALAAMRVALGLVFLVRAEGAGPAIAAAIAVAVLSSNVCLHVRRLKRRAATYLDHRPEPPVVVHDARDAA
jgi:hypothetical protein